MMISSKSHNPGLQQPKIETWCA